MTNVQAPAEPGLSTYGAKRVPQGEAIGKVQEVMGNQYSDSNPTGIVSLAVAENTVIWEELRDLFEKSFKLRKVDFTYGDSLYGSIRLRGALAKLFNARFNPFKPVSANDLMTGNGLLSVISQVGRALVDPGNGVLLATPYYHGFDLSLSTQADVQVVGVDIPYNDMFDVLQELEYFEKALADSRSRGVDIQAVILCNPQNPYGRCYTPELIAAYCQFCERHNLHLISNEIYALSIFPSDDVPNPTPFTSVLSLDLDALGVTPDRVHMIYGMSKDFDANGFRAGVLYTKNQDLLKALLPTSFFMLVGSPSAALWFSLLDDEAPLNHFIQRNQAALHESYNHFTSWLKFHRIPYRPSSAGHFVMVDLRPVLSDINRYGADVQITDAMTMREREVMFSTFLASHKVLVGRGSAFHMPEGGWYRFTFSIEREVMDVGLKRMEDALGWDRWPGLLPTENHPSS